MPDRLTPILLLALLLAGCSEQPAEGLGQGRELRFLDGSSATPASLQGRWLLVNYWAEWCAPCREEVPELNALQAAHGDRLQVIGINFDGLSAQDLAVDVEALGIEFPVALGRAGAVLGIRPPEVLPSTYLFAPDGRLVSTLVGPQTGEALLSALEPLAQSASQ